MEKYGQTDSRLKDSLLMEEANLMGRIAMLMPVGEKTAEQHRELSELETRIHHIRTKITEIDLGGQI